MLPAFYAALCLGLKAVVPQAGHIHAGRFAQNQLAEQQACAGADAEADLCIAKPIGQVLSEDVTLDL